KRRVDRQPPGPPARLVLEQVVPVSTAAHHLAGTGQPKPLRGPAVGLHLRHGCRLRLLRAWGAASPAPGGATPPHRRAGVSAAGGVTFSCLHPRRPAMRGPPGHALASAAAAQPWTSASGVLWGSAPSAGWAAAALFRAARCRDRSPCCADRSAF